MSFSERLQKELSSRNWTRSHLVVAMTDHGVPVTEGAVYAWLTGRRTPRLEYLPGIARALDTTVDELVGLEPRQPAGVDAKERGRH